jgi:hypothetical protein
MMICRSNRSFVGDELYDVLVGVLILAVLVFASGHEVKKTRHADVYLFVVGESAGLCGELALSKRIVYARLCAEIVGKSAFVALGAVVLVIEFAAEFLGWFWFDDLPFDGVGKKAVESVLAVAHVEVDAGVVAAFDMGFAAFWTLTRTLWS